MIDQTAESCEALAKAIFKISNDLNRKILIVASSDFTHYEAADIVEKKDRKLIAPLLAGDVKNFEETRKSENISCCGHGPIMVLAYYANLRGFGGAELLRYTHSGAITGDYTEVVGYAAVRFLETLF